MSSDNPHPEQAQAKIATALGRLRGDVMPPITSQAVPRLSDQIGTAPLPMASTLRAEPTLGAASASPAPANLNPSTVAPVSAASLGGATGPAASGLGNNASGSSYLGAPNTASGNTAGGQPDLLAGVDMGPPPLGADYPRAEVDDGRRKRNRRLVGIAAIVAAVVIVGFWFTTRHRGEVPEIAADTSPEKVKPTDQGGLQVPNQNVQVLENMNGQPKAQSGETVLPPPEQPVSPPAVADQTAAANPAAPATTNDNTQQAAQSTPAAPVVPSVQAPAVPASPTTGTAATATPTVPAVPAVPTANSSAMTSSPAVPTASAANSNAAPGTAPTAATTSEPAAKTATAATPATATTTAASAGKLRIQLAAVKTEAAATATWAKLQKAHPAQLGNLSLMVEKVDKGTEGVFYRVQAGPFADKSAAKSVCSALSAQGQACILAH